MNQTEADWTARLNPVHFWLSGQEIDRPELAVSECKPVSNAHLRGSNQQKKKSKGRLGVVVMPKHTA